STLCRRSLATLRAVGKARLELVHLENEIELERRELGPNGALGLPTQSFDPRRSAWIVNSSRPRQLRLAEPLFHIADRAHVATAAVKRKRVIPALLLRTVLVEEERGLLPDLGIGCLGVHADRVAAGGELEVG